MTQYPAVSRNLILCFDGTHNQFESLPFTNVLKLFRMLEKDNDNQICYYQPGIGAAMTAEFGRLTEGAYLTKAYATGMEYIDTLIAYSLDAHIIDAYTWLMKFYKEGDKIYMFGFSRGAFTARVLAGMIERVGLLNSGLENMVSTAWKVHRTWEHDGQPDENYGSDEVANEFKTTFSRPNVCIHFMGLWDSINSVGIVRDRLFPYSSWSDTVKHVRHAVSMDERRGKFKQNLFVPISYTQPLYPLTCKQKVITCPRKRSQSFFQKLFGRDLSGSEHSMAVTDADHISTDLVELWFPGCHGDIGGAWPEDFNGQNMANVALRWMLASAIEFGVIFKKNAIHEFADQHPSLDSLLSCHHDPLWTFRNVPMNHPDADPWMTPHHHRHFVPTSEDDQKHTAAFPSSKTLDGPPAEPIKNFDSRGDDSFLRSLFWWLLEIIPIGVFIEDESQKWRRVYVPNLGRRRLIPQGAQAHWSFYWRRHYVSDYEGPDNLPKEIEEEWERLNLELQPSDKPSVSQSWSDIPDDLAKWLQLYPDI
ncbi:unnamed protein product [Kuraishia capsulata CBS 1993]|uniref:T6SS Phospholipase effector Tle1-like catalytic domain-containing protein n=1 Tax=Kuraishia capsulata CBS 1993 TaxID=1382522 RepID=W6MNI9_9ASCO|nr:uncharacterized protein KUCA_T00002580001 [Kuraishia capsulata CBS 1993]CDK26607.1 unnamed protein product [Kuraishia capsulata CBS 1993]